MIICKEKGNYAEILIQLILLIMFFFFLLMHFITFFLYTNYRLCHDELELAGSYQVGL